MRTEAPSTRLARGLAVALALAVTFGAAAPESNARADARIHALKSGKAKLYGTRALDWAFQWWQWALSLPVPVNPLLDGTGEFVEMGQRGPVWFLAGIFNETGTAVRTATIPTGKALFFPILNGENDNVGRDPPLTLEEMLATSLASYDRTVAESLYVTVDGVPIQGLADSSWMAGGPFTYAMPDDNVQQLFGLPAPRGVYAPAVTDGYWVMLRPLAEGNHVVHFGGTTGLFTLDITYNLTVVESNQP